jgi:hypothetical protein
VEVGCGDGDRPQPEAPGNADAAPATPWVRDEVAQRTRTGSALGTSRPLRRTT